VQLKSWLNQLTLSHDQTKKAIREKENKNYELIKLENGSKIREISQKRWGKLSSDIGGKM